MKTKNESACHEGKESGKLGTWETHTLHCADNARGRLEIIYGGKMLKKLKLNFDKMKFCEIKGFLPSLSFI